MPQSGGGALVAGIDLGGSGMRVAIAGADGLLRARRSQPIDPRAGAESLIALAAATVADLRAELAPGDGRLRAIGIGTPGLVDAREGCVRSAANLAGWRDVPVRDMLTARLGVPVCLENDVNVAALGERAHGVARDWDTFVFVALGTGLGAGIVVNGELMRGAHHAAGEIGFSCVDERHLGPHFRGDGRLEALVGGPGITRRARARGLQHGAAGDAAVFDAARAGDMRARELVAETARWLGIAIGNLAAALDPEGIVLGGGIGSQADLLLDPIRAVVDQITPAPVAVVASGLGVDAQLHGAIASALRLAGIAPGGQRASPLFRLQRTERGRG